MIRRAVVFGARGMLGSELCRVLSTEFEVLKVGRGCDVEFVAGQDDLEELAEAEKFCDSDILINCLGWIPQKSLGNLGADSIVAITSNVLFPAQLSKVAALTDSKVLEIGTDCVFSGKTGGYSELDAHDASDLYGRTKSLGELVGQNTQTLRSSIVGLSSSKGVGLLDWFLSSRHGENVMGFQNHLWNGVTTLAWAKIARGIIREGCLDFGTHHLVPANCLSKFELLSCVKTLAKRDDIIVDGVTLPTEVNRTLKTQSVAQNVRYWKLAGYSSVPSIEELLTEMFSEVAHG